MLGRSWIVVLALVSIIVAGCGSQPSADTSGKSSAAVKSGGEEHAHGAGPHGGSIADWGGGKYHVEFTVDHDKKEATVFVLGSDAKSPAPIKTPKLLLSISTPSFQTDLTAQPLESEKNESSSRFVGRHDHLGKVQEFSGTISGEVDGTPYAGDFKEEPAGQGHTHMKK